MLFYYIYSKKKKSKLVFALVIFLFALGKYDFYYHNILSVNIASNASIWIEIFKNNLFFFFFPERKLLQVSLAFSPPPLAKEIC